MGAEPVGENGDTLEADVEPTGNEFAYRMYTGYIIHTNTGKRVLDFYSGYSY